MESMIMIVALMAVMYFFMIRPENKRKKQAQNMRDSLKKGDMITTIGGMSQVGVQTGEQPEAEKKEKKTEKKEETPAVEAPKADEDEKN